MSLPIDGNENEPPRERRAQQLQKARRRRFRQRVNQHEAAELGVPRSEIERQRTSHRKADCDDRRRTFRELLVGELDRTGEVAEGARREVRRRTP